MLSSLNRPLIWFRVYSLSPRKPDKHFWSLLRMIMVNSVHNKILSMFCLSFSVADGQMTLSPYVYHGEIALIKSNKMLYRPSCGVRMCLSVGLLCAHTHTHTQMSQSNYDCRWKRIYNEFNSIQDINTTSKITWQWQLWVPSLPLVV